MTNPTIDPISYNAGIDACSFCRSADVNVFECEDETAGASIFWVECESCSARGPTSEYKDGAVIHWNARPEPQTAPTCICPRCSATIVGEMNGPEDEPQTAPAADRETLQILLDLLNPLHGSLDRQMYVDKPNPDFDPHPDDETDVIVTAKMERDLTQAVCIIESRLKDGVIPEPSSASPADAERLALVDQVARLEKLVYVPGLWRCAKCDFQLQQMNLNAGDGTVTARNQAGDKCPNCASPLWRVTEREAGNRLCDDLERVVLERNALEKEVSSLRAGGWREDMPPVSVGCEREFIVAVYRASSGKAYTFAASYLNAYPLQYEHECPKWKEGVGCSGEGCDDGCPTTGWFEQTGDDDYSSMYNRLELREGDIFLGWSELPKWNGPLPSSPHTDKND